MSYAAPNFAHIVHKPMPKNEIAFELEPLAQSHRGFETRLPPVTEADHVAVGLAVNAKKASPDWDGLTLDFALSQQVGRERAA
jgi:hypothetical protein